MLNRGDIGADVAAWQTFLHWKGFRSWRGERLEVTAEFDDDTVYATMRFQYSNGLRQTGTLCPTTEAMAKRLGWVQSA